MLEREGYGGKSQGGIDVGELASPICDQRLAPYRCQTPALAFVRSVTPLSDVRFITLARCEVPPNAPSGVSDHLRKGRLDSRVDVLEPRESSKRVEVSVVQQHDHAAEDFGVVATPSDLVVKFFGNRSADIDLHRQTVVRTHKLT